MIEFNNNISIIGNGNVATQLAHAFANTAVTVTHIAGRNTKAVQQLAKSVKAVACTVKDLPKDQFTIVCISDDAISSVLLEIDIDIPVAYTSGSVSMDKIPTRMNLGVFYPLQTFTKDRTVDLSKVPFFIEATNKRFADLLIDLAKEISPNVSIANSEQRGKMHVAAVMVNNFTNHILHQAKTFADANDIDFKHFIPLLNETVAKLSDTPPLEAQTGPARRGDEQIISKHISMLEGTPKELYTLLSKSIKNTYSKDDEL